MDVKVRKATEVDVEIVVEFLLEMQKEEKNFDFLLKDPKEGVVRETIRKYVENCLNGMRNDSRIFLVAEAEGKVVGFVTGRVFSYGGLYEKGKVLYVDNLYVVENVRSQGVGSKLLLALEEEARKAEIKIVELDAYIRSKSSVQFYEKRGYSPIYIRMRKVLSNHRKK